MWQLDVARDKSHQESLERAASMPVEDVAKVLPPHTPLTSQLVGRNVKATGTYDAEHQLIVVQRQLEGSVGYWVMTPLDVNGSYLPVVRGWVSDPAQVQPPPSGEVTVVGALAPPESAPDKDLGLAPGQVSTIDVASLVNEWDAGTFSAFMYMESEQLASGAAVPWTPTLVPSPGFGEGGIEWRNLAYALQWWFFAAFAVYMWFRMVREDAQGPREFAEPISAGAAPAEGDPTPAEQTVQTTQTTEPTDTAAGGARS